MSGAVNAGIDATLRRRSLVFLGLAVAGVGFTMAIQMGLNTNFLVEEIHVSAFEQGPHVWMPLPNSMTLAAAISIVAATFVGPHVARTPAPEAAVAEE